MSNASQLIKEMKKKSRPDSKDQTVISAPIKGPNQDRSGEGVTHDTADYTISDAVIAGVGGVRVQPVNMAQSVAQPKAKNAPASADNLQNAANKRVAQLDNMAQQQKDKQIKDREDQVKQRTAAAAKNKVGMGMSKDTKNEGYMHIGPADGSSPYNKFGDKKPGTRTLGNDSKREKRDVEPRSPVKKNINDRLTTTREEVEHIIEVIGDHAGLAKYADEHGRLDTDDLRRAAEHMKDHNMGALRRHLQNMDTDPRDKALEYVNKKHYAKLGYSAEEVQYVDEASSAMKSLASKKKSGTERAHKETHGISSKRFAVRQIDKSKPVKHKVDVHVVTDNGVERKYQDVVHAKDKHSAIFQTQRKYAEFGKKMGYSIDKVVHKGMVKEEVEGIDESSKATVASYSYRAGRQVMGNQPSDPDKLRKRNNREQGLKLAYKKFYGHYKVKVPATEEIEYVDEAKKEPEARDLGDRHIIMQMRKVISTRGAHHVSFNDGKSHAMNPMTAHRVIAMHDNLRLPAEKEAFASRIHKSADHMRDALAGKPEQIKPKISLGGSSNIGGVGGANRK